MLGFEEFCLLVCFEVFFFFFRINMLNGFLVGIPQFL